MQRNNKQRGQGMTEYIIIVALIAIAAIAAFSYFGQSVRSQTAGMALEIAGQSSDKAVEKAQSAANSAIEQGSAKKGLADYGKDNPHDSGGSK